MLNEKELIRVKAFAAQIRLETLKELAHLGFGHVGGAMSIVETLAVLYDAQMKYDPKDPRWDRRDWYIQSKGHAGPATYAALALKGFFPMSWLNTLNQGGTRLPSHCDRNLTPGIDMTTGSLGQGVSVALGVAAAFKMDGKDNRVYLMVGDGELNEGQVWEGAMFASAKKIDNLIWFVDWNKQQLDGNTKDVCDMGDLKAKFEAFGFNVQVINGHCVKAIDDAIDAAKAVTDKPSVIILETIKGYGCSAAEGVVPNHHIAFKAGQLDGDIARWQSEYDALMAQL
ncbi:MAG: transketolase [Clostridiales bacterium]|jgi:transketolase|nr:transketolase [Clostridiales bacterium]